jgi:hypothetical protein
MESTANFEEQVSKIAYIVIELYIQQNTIYDRGIIKEDIDLEFNLIFIKKVGIANKAVVCEYLF